MGALDAAMDAKLEAAKKATSTTTPTATPTGRVNTTTLAGIEAASGPVVATPVIPVKTIAPTWAKVKTVNTANGPVDVDANGIAADGSTPVAVVVKTNSDVPAGFNSGPFPKGLEQYFGLGSQFSAWRIVTNDDGSQQLEVATSPNTTQIFGYKFKSNGSGAYVPFNSSSSGNGNGNGTGNGDGTGNGSGVSQTAKDVVISFLKEAGMEGLADSVWAKWTSGATAAQIIEDIRKSPQYAERYPGMAALNKSGRNISEASYIAKETADIELMKRYGIPSGIFDNKKYLGSLIENNVDLTTLQLRLIAAQDTVLSYDTSIKDYAKTTYGLDDGHLMAWALDPTMALPVIQQQAKAIQIGGAALAAGIKIADITKTEAESLAAAGVTQDQAKQGFVNIAQMGQYKEALPGANPAETVTNEDLINAQFATSPDAIVKVNKAKQSKLAEFAQGGQFAATQAGLVGLGNAPVI
jgi:hypothetical protein